MTFFERFFGKGRQATVARNAELRGDLAEAARLYDEAGLPDDVARVLLLRAEGETDARARLQFLAQAAHVAPPDSEVARTARLGRAELVLALAGDAAVSSIARQEVLEAARTLEALGEPLKAAEAFARAGDTEGEARALEAAGDVERLEFLLSSEQHKARVSRARESRTKDVDLMLACGRRREALAALEELARETPDDRSLQARVADLRARRVGAPIVVFEAGGRRWRIALGDEVVVGRAEGTVLVASSAISRRHLQIARANGEVIVRDLESRNGTQLRGINLAGPIAIHEGLDLKLGREVALRVAPSKVLEGAVDLEVAGATYVAWLGPAKSPVPRFDLEVGADGWVELVVRNAGEGAATRAFLGDVELAPRATLLVGDAIATTRGAEPALRVLSPTDRA